MKYYIDVTDTLAALDVEMLTFKAVIWFEYHPGFRGDMTDPPEPESVEYHGLDRIMCHGIRRPVLDEWARRWFDQNEAAALAVVHGAREKGDAT